MGRGASMKVKRKAGPPLGPWDIAAFVMAGLLYLDVLCFLILMVAGIGLLLVYALECGIVTGVLLLLFALAVGALILYTATYTAGL